MFQFDTDIDGAVNTAEAGLIMRSVGFNPSDADIQDWHFCPAYWMIHFSLQDMVMLVDKDGTGSINFPEFLNMMSDKADTENVEEEIRGAFTVCDK